MEVSSVSSATTSTIQQQPPAVVSQTEQKPVEQSGAKTQEVVQAEQPKPVVNAQGQKIGSIINATA